MNSVIEFLHDYDDLPSALARELFRLRRKTFRDRLDWKVECVEDMEKDQFDNPNTTYLLGMYEESCYAARDSLIRRIRQ